jgi:hypothetical protein
VIIIPGRPKGSTNKVINGAPKHTEKPILRAPTPEEDKIYYCTSCGKGYKRLKGNFRASQSPFYQGWGFIPVCIKCLDHFEKEYTERLGNNDEAIKRLALHLDLYLDESLLGSSRKINADNSRIAGYIANANLVQYKDKTYDTFLEELAEQERLNNKIESLDDLDEIQNENINPKTLSFWGMGFAPEDYIYLNDKYEDWTSRHECKTKAQESIFQKICLMELQITKAIQNGDKVDGLIKSFNDLLGSANIKPVQNKDNSLADQNTFGTLIQKWENEKPVPEPDPEWDDIDGIGKYIKIFFLGHLCKMLNINNSYAQLYEEEISKYTVESPQYEEDSDLSYDDLFGKVENKNVDDEEVG